MANEKKKMVSEITSMDEDFTQWYTDVCIKAGLISYSNIKGCMVIKPSGYAIWELIQKHLDARFTHGLHGRLVHRGDGCRLSVVWGTGYGT